MPGAGNNLLHWDVPIFHLNQVLQPHNHLCVIYENDQEWCDVVVPFVATSLEFGQKCIYITDTSKAEDISRHLAGRGIDVDCAIDSGQLTLHQQADTYTRGGTFDPDAMIALLIREVEKAVDEGFPALCVTGEMSWALRGAVGTERLLEYEAKLNRDVFPHYPCLALCQYDRRTFDPDVIKGVMMTHPLVARGTRVFRNFYYIPPERFLEGPLEEVEVQNWLENLERDQAQRDELQKREALYRGLFEHSHEGIALLEVSGRLIEYNHAWLDLFGYTAEEIQNVTAPDVYVDRFEREDFIRQLREVGFVRDEVRHRWKGGDVMVCLRSAVAHKDEQGNLVAIQNLMLDVTEQRRAERAMLDSEEKFRKLFEQSMDAISIATTEGRIVDANGAWLDLFGYEESDLPSINVADLYADASERDDFLRRIVAEEYICDEVRLRRRDGSVFDSERSVSAIKDPSGHMIRFQSLVRDVSERKKAELELQAYLQQIEEANRQLRDIDQLKSVFLASMSHELRTPLNSIIGFTGVLLMGIAGELTEEQRKQLTMVKNSANHLLDLINDILDISKIEANKVELALARFDFAELVQDVVTSVSAAASHKGLSLTVDVPQGITIYSDRRRVRQVLVNLLSNAIKFTERGGVAIDVAAIRSTWLEVRVSDTGTGIRLEDMSRLFQPFQQVGVSHMQKHEGTGLGLYLTKKLCGLLQGDISVASEFGRGSVFTFTVPLDYRETGE